MSNEDPIDPNTSANIDNEEDEECAIKLPVLQYGYRTTRASWSDLESIVASKDLARLSRSRQQQTEYERYKQNILKTWKSLLDYMLCEKFHHVVEMDESSGKKYARADRHHGHIRKLLPNDFPYYMHETIEHWIL
jgi:hypothetical protein